MINASLFERLVDEKSAVYREASDRIWDFAEIRFCERRSSSLLSGLLEKEGFSVRRGVGEIPTAFVAEYGSGSPTVGFLGEFDALAGMSQKAGIARREPLVPGGNGHACGHHALGVASAAAAVAVKDAMKRGEISGTVRFFGCPAEEVGHGKVFLVREGVFQGTDVMLTWHPGDTNGVLTSGTLALRFQKFEFLGIAAHASGNPQNGRSALDALELMNVGANFLREHIVQEARVHYAILDAGGVSPNIVPPHASVLYEVRAPGMRQVDEICARVERIARGAAMMTDTECRKENRGGMHDCIVNETLCRVMHSCMEEIGPQKNDEDEDRFAKEIASTLTDEDRANAMHGTELLLSPSDRSRMEGRQIADFIAEYRPYTGECVKISSDVGDVSWVIPTAQCVAACETFGTPGHSWQIVAQGKAEIFHRGMLLAAKTMAYTAAQVFCRPELAAAAKAELKKRRNGEYRSPLAPGEKPDIPGKNQ